MTKATFYYLSPLGFDDPLSWMKGLFENEARSDIDNVYDLVSKLKKAKLELSKNSPLEAYAFEDHFPKFSFVINSKKGIYSSVDKLLEISYPIFPYGVLSNKEGYDVVNSILDLKYDGHLKRNFLRSGKIVSIPGIEP